LHPSAECRLALGKPALIARAISCSRIAAARPHPVPCARQAFASLSKTLVSRAPFRRHYTK
jgi:hypothetical protein